jgi:hypothetical protein
MEIEIFDQQIIQKKWKNYDAHTQDYLPHIGYGASGTYDSITKKGTIRSYMKKCKELEKAGYKNLKFCNGGDDDWLVVDHDAKEFGFFEDYAPSLERAVKFDNLTTLWNNH